MRNWFFENIPDFRPVVGFQTAFPVHSDERVFTHQWKITEVTAPTSITYSWSYAEYPGAAIARFELEENDGTVTLRLTMTVTEDFPQDVAEFERESCIGGWNYFLGERLRKLLED